MAETPRATRKTVATTDTAAAAYAPIRSVRLYETIIERIAALVETIWNEG